MLEVNIESPLHFRIAQLQIRQQCVFAFDYFRLGPSLCGFLGHVEELRLSSRIEGAPFLIYRRGSIKHTFCPIKVTTNLTSHVGLSSTILAQNRLSFLMGTPLLIVFYLLIRHQLQVLATPIEYNLFRLIRRLSLAQCPLDIPTLFMSEKRGILLLKVQHTGTSYVVARRAHELRAFHIWPPS